MSFWSFQENKLSNIHHSLLNFIDRNILYFWAEWDLLKRLQSRLNHFQIFVSLLTQRKRKSKSVMKIKVFLWKHLLIHIITDEPYRRKTFLSKLNETPTATSPSSTKVKYIYSIKKMRMAPDPLWFWPFYTTICHGDENRDKIRLKMILPLKISTLSLELFSPLPALLQFAQFLAVLCAVSADYGNTDYGNTGCGVFKRGVQN